jgi:hypothetical protein
MLWAPTETRIAYQTPDALHVVGASDRLLYNTGNAGSLELGGWLADGRSLVVSVLADDAWTIYLVDATSGSMRSLGPGFHAATSPNGTQIAAAVSTATAASPYATSLQVIQTATGERRTIFASGNPIAALAWSPDSRQVAFLWMNDVLPNLMAQNADGSSTGLFGRTAGALPTQVTMSGPIVWTRGGIVGVDRAPGSSGASLEFYDVVTGKASNYGLRGANEWPGQASGGARGIPYLVSSQKTEAPVSLGALRVTQWLANGDRSVRACDGSAHGDVIRVAALPTNVAALGGNDWIDARNGKRDHINCGRGLDIVKADRADIVFGCERVTRSGRRGREIRDQ